MVLLNKRLQYTAIAFLLGVIVIMGVLVLITLRADERQSTVLEETYKLLEPVRVHIEEVFAVPSVVFETLEESGKFDTIRDAYTDGAYNTETWNEEMSAFLDRIRATSGVVSGVYIADRQGAILASAGDVYMESDYRLDAVDRALLLREGEVAISRFRSMTTVGGSREDVILYSTPIECRGCAGQPQIAAAIVAISRNNFFSNVPYDDRLSGLFLVNAEGQYVYVRNAQYPESPTSTASLHVFASDFPDDYATIIEFRGTRFFPSKDGKRTFFVQTLYPGLDGRIGGVPRKLNTRYIPTAQQFWVLGFYTQHK